MATTKNPPPEDQKPASEAKKIPEDVQKLIDNAGHLGEHVQNFLAQSAKMGVDHARV